LVVDRTSSPAKFGAERSAAGAEMSAAFHQPDTLDLSSVGPLAKVTLAMQLLPKTVMREPRQCDADRLAKLKSELTAMELRESDYCQCGCTMILTLLRTELD
jgi:hypothetical protein